MTRPEGSKKELEARRKEAVKLLERGASVPEVAELKDVTLKSVYRWKETYDEEGLDGLDAIPNTGGRDPKLPEEKLPELEELLLDGAEAHGFEGDLWTLSRVATIIEREFDKSVSTSSARRYLKNLTGATSVLSVALPSATLTKSSSGERSGSISKKAYRCNETIVFIDESAFRLIPTFHRTWAPQGETPFIETESSTDPVAVISALAYTPETGDCELYFRSQ